MKRLLLAVAVLACCSLARADNFYVYSRGQTYLGSYNSSGGYMIGPQLQITQWGGRPLYVQQPQQYVPPGYYTYPQPYYRPQPVFRWGW